MDDLWEWPTDLICVYRMSRKVVSSSRLDLMCKTHITTTHFMQDWWFLWPTPFYKTINIYYQKNVKIMCLEDVLIISWNLTVNQLWVFLHLFTCLIQPVLLRCWPSVCLFRQYCRSNRNIACHCTTKAQGDRKTCIYFQGGIAKEQFLSQEHTSREIFRDCHYRSYLTVMQK